MGGINGGGQWKKGKWQLGARATRAYTREMIALRFSAQIRHRVCPNPVFRPPTAMPAIQFPAMKNDLLLRAARGSSFPPRLSFVANLISDR